MATRKSASARQSKTDESAKKRPPREGEGRPSEYREEYPEQARKLCLLGFTDAELGEFFDVSETTINNWKRQHPEFLASIRAGKVVADSEVAASMFQSATGGLVETEVVRKQPSGESVAIKVKKYIPPDVQAGRLWLFNRRGKDWRDKQEIEHSGSVSVMDVINSARQRAQS